MRFMMMYAKKGTAPPECSRLCCFQPHYQSSRQSRSTSGCHSPDVTRLCSSFLQRPPYNRKQVAQMLSRGYFRHHASVLRMDLNL